jgi:hypothetical protein
MSSASSVDLRGPQPLLLVADRVNARLQYFTLDGRHHSFVGGMNLPCHFSERRGEFVIPDLGARVALMDRDNKVITHLGDDSAAKTFWDLRKQTRDHFTPGKFVCPHGACFDHEGNILVVEWAEVGRVSRLRKVG